MVHVPNARNHSMHALEGRDEFGVILIRYGTDVDATGGQIGSGSSGEKDYGVFVSGEDPSAD